MRLTCLVLVISAAAPLTVRGQAADTGQADSRRTAFSIQPLFEGRSGPRFELERGITRRFSLTAATRLTMRQVDFLERFPRPEEVDVGLRYYPAGRTFHGPFAGASVGYDRNILGVNPGPQYQLGRYFLGGTLGYDFVIGRRLIIAPAVGAEYGRPTPAAGIKAWEVHPRLGIGFKFD